MVTRKKPRRNKLTLLRPVNWSGRPIRGPKAETWGLANLELKGGGGSVQDPPNILLICTFSSLFAMGIKTVRIPIGLRSSEAQ